MPRPTRLAGVLARQSIALLALCLALSGATAYAVSTAAKNSVVSTSIKNGQVKKADLATDSVTGRSVDDDALSGDDIDESTLDTVPLAEDAGLGGTVRGVVDRACNPDTLAYETCATVSISTQAPSNLVLLGEVRVAHQTNSLYGADGYCRFRVDGALLAGGGTTWVSKADKEFYATSPLVGGAGVAAGDHQVTVECNDQYYATYTNLDLSVLALSGR